MHADDAPALSVVLPIFEEEESLPTLLEEIHTALDGLLTFEIVCVDDGSRDRSHAVLERLAATDPSLVVIRFRRNFGQTAALQAGLDYARGGVVATLDADLQNDPADIPKMMALLDNGFDLVTGWRADRKDAFLNRRLPSMVANLLISTITGVHLHDYGCTLKVMRSDVAKELRLYGEMHRFIPAIASWMGIAYTEVEVNHRARRHGITKYGIGRTLRVVLDLLTVRFLSSYLVRPMQAFGLWGLLFGGSGFAICAWLSMQKVLLGTELSERPLLLLGVLLMVFGVQFLSFGLVADLVARTYHEAQDRKPYFVRSVVRGAANDGR